MSWATHKWSQAGESINTVQSHNIEVGLLTQNEVIFSGLTMFGLRIFEATRWLDLSIASGLQIMTGRLE